MGFRTRVALLVIVLSIGFAESAEAQARVTVAVFNDAGVPSTVISGAGNRAADIYRRAGIELAWIDCSSRSNRDACLRPSDGSARFALRIVHRSFHLKSEIFGIAFLGEDGRGSQADIFFDRVQNLAASAQVSLGDLLGHVAAHELGHLLLGTNAHAKTGIMRAHWERRELHSASMGNLLFLGEQAARLRQRLSTYREMSREFWDVVRMPLTVIQSAASSLANSRAEMASTLFPSG